MVAELGLPVVLAAIEQAPFAQEPEARGYAIDRAAGDVHGRGCLGRRAAAEEVDDDQVAGLQARLAALAHSPNQLLLVGETQFGDNPVHGNSSFWARARLEHYTLEFPFLYPQPLDLQEVTRRSAILHGHLEQSQSTRSVYPQCL